MSLVSSYYLERPLALLFLKGPPHLPNENWDSQMSLGTLTTLSARTAVLFLERDYTPPIPRER